MSNQVTLETIAYQIDSDLREVPDDLQTTLAYIENLETSAAREQDHYEQMKLYSELSFYCRIVMQLDEAERYAYSAIALAHDLLDKRTRLVNLIHLAQIYQWSDAYIACDRILEQVIDACEASQDASRPERHNPFSDYLPLTYFSLGRSKFDQGDFAVASDLFQAALDVSEESDDLDVYQYALEIAQLRLTGL